MPFCGRFILKEKTLVKKIYLKPTLAKRGKLSAVIAGGLSSPGPVAT